MLVLFVNWGLMLFAIPFYLNQFWTFLHEFWGFMENNSIEERRWGVKDFYGNKQKLETEKNYLLLRFRAQL